MNNLTERDTWARYWENYQYKPLPGKPLFAKYLTGHIDNNSSFIEIGGFPGVNAAYVYNYFCKDVTILDYYIDPLIINKIEEENAIPAGSINYIESDFFTFNGTTSYDVVFSLGFIEHFKDTRDVLKRHVDRMKPGGTLLVILPNLRGLNGLIQYLFDRKNLRIHNLKCMDLKLLSTLMAEFDLKDVKVEYTRKPMVWLEPQPTLMNKVGRIFTKLFSYFIKLFPVKGRLLSPYIVIFAKK